MPRLDWSVLPASTRAWRGCSASYTGWRCRNGSFSGCACWCTTVCMRENQHTWLSPSVAPLAAILDDTRGLMTPSRCWYGRRDVPHSETGLSLWRPPEPGMHCGPASDVKRRLIRIVRRQLMTDLFHVSFPEQLLTNPITVILIWRFMHFYRILYCFYIFIQWSCSNCDSATLKIHFVIIITGLIC